MPQKTELELLTESNELLKNELQRVNDDNQSLRAEIGTLKARKDVIPTPKSAPPPPFTFSGRLGGPFSLDGKGFGETTGVLLIDDRNVVPTRWKDHNIKGMVPADFKAGKHTVTVNGTKVEVKF